MLWYIYFQTILILSFIAWKYQQKGLLSSQKGAQRCFSE